MSNMPDPRQKAKKKAASDRLGQFMRPELSDKTNSQNQGYVRLA
jgi:hypothetical protein